MLQNIKEQQAMRTRIMPNCVVTRKFSVNRKALLIDWE